MNNVYWLLIVEWRDHRGAFCAGAVWRQGKPWVCVEAAPALRWMKTMTAEEAKKRMIRMNATWEFIREDPPTSSGR